jgi:selenocysteine-specific elongation factor
MLTLGTAGHIDHGKSTLVKALTSIDPDRLPEEKRRGMTIDLGFAWLQASSGEAVGIVDVPGHKHFVRNVIPGLGGIDAALLVVAADDGWMPQTEEHVHILDLLGVKHGIVALTKVDLIDDPNWLELVEKDIDERLAQTSLVNSPLIRVSCKDGSGIQQLKEAIDQLVLKIVPRKDIGKPRLPIDRVFIMKGSGVVVTGTLINGCLPSGADVIISPSGLAAHIRTIESYKQQAGRAQPGSRVALNLSGVKKDELKRGDIVLTTGKQARTSRIIDVEIRLIPHLERLKNNTELVVYLETSELLGRITLFGAKAIQSQEPALAQIRFNQDVATYIGEHFILRQQSPARTIGGGTILDPFAAKYRTRDADKIIEFLKKRKSLGLEELILSEVERRKYIEREELLGASCYSSAEIASSVTKLLNEGRLMATKSYVIDLEYWQKQSKKIPEILQREHSLDPLKEGLPQAVMHSYLALPKEAFSRLIGTLIDKGQVVREEDTIALPSHKLKLAQEREVKISKIAAIFAKSHSSPPTMKELVTQMPGSEDAIRVMCQHNILIELTSGILFEKEHYENTKSEIIKFLKRNGQISIQDIHSLFGFSRKYTIPLLNYLEKEGIVRREGDIRVLVNKQD